MTEAAALRTLMRTPDRETWERLLYRGLYVRGKDVTALPDADLVAVADGFDRRRCQGMRAGDNLRLAVREAEAGQLRAAQRQADADATARAAKAERPRRKGRRSDGQGRQAG